MSDYERDNLQVAVELMVHEDVRGPPRPGAIGAKEIVALLTHREHELMMLTFDGWGWRNAVERYRKNGYLTLAVREGTTPFEDPATCWLCRDFGCAP